MGDRLAGEPVAPVEATRKLRRFLIGTAIFFLFVQVGLIAAFLILGEYRFLFETKSVGVWGIVLTLCYKQIVILVMLTTPNKSLLDLSFIWQTQAVALLFVYAWVSIEHPEVLVAHPLAAGWVWFELWSQVFASSLCVLIALWNERLVWVYRSMRVVGWRGILDLPDIMRGVLPNEYADRRPDHMDR